MEKPALRRDIQPVATMIKGRQMIAFHDPYHLADHSIVLDMNALPILQLLDGNHDMRDIQMMLMQRQGGRMVYISEIESFIETLDKACLLNSDIFNHKMNGLRNDFKKMQTRPPVHAGKSYIAEPDQLSEFIRNAENNISQGYEHNVPDKITGIIAPHIDIKIATEAYIKAYRNLKGKHYDLVVIFGINHHEQEGLYCVSEKNFLSPFGEISTDRNFISEMRKRLPLGTLTPDDFGHMTEHSIEFQTIFLHYYLDGPFSIVSILCGGVHDFIHENKNILHDERFRGMIDALAELTDKGNSNTLFVAGVDLSHVGHKFGDQTPSDVILPQATSNDKRILSFLARCEPENIFQNAVETQDRYRVCGLPALLPFSCLLKGNSATILHFDTYQERETRSAVNYASMLFSPESE
jgi:AmmeMemoRadiSam system protein B